MQSVRLPGKPLLPIAGIPMIVRVLERARACTELDRIIVATDSREIADVVEGAGGEARLTSPAHRTGSDRVAEVAAGIDEELVLNLQGDEPLLPASTVGRLVEFARRHPDLTVVTATLPIVREGDAVNPNIVKAVGSADGRALYFSRWPVPYFKSAPLDPGVHGSGRSISGCRKHIGIYLYRREFLLKFVKLEPTPLEIAESLEQLRILEHGYPIHLVEAVEDSLAVDTAEDLERVEAVLAGLGAEPADPA
jgi:3-deoxy-manno-octulosonate cytidylyltransferase (CMP-KDO synthetase)